MSWKMDTQHRRQKFLASDDENEDIITYQNSAHIAKLPNKISVIVASKIYFSFVFNSEGG